MQPLTEVGGKMELETIIQFQDKLLEWYDGSARTLPWRDDPSCYEIKTRFGW